MKAINQLNREPVQCVQNRTFHKLSSGEQSNQIKSNTILFLRPKVDQ